MALGGARPGAGRPAGSPNKATAELREFAGQYTKTAIEGLLAIAQDEEAPHAAKVGAWREILDRAVGKAPQAVTGPDGESLHIPNAVQFVIQQAPDSDNKT